MPVNAYPQKSTRGEVVTAGENFFVFPSSPDEEQSPETLLVMPSVY
jgi:hypothetical protein